MSRAHELLPIPARDAPEEHMPGMALTKQHRNEPVIEERFISGPPGASEVRTLIDQPPERNETLSVLLHLHGGALCFMHPETSAGIEAGWALDLDCVVVSVDDAIEVEPYNCPGAYHGAPPLEPRMAATAYQVYTEALRAALHPGPG